MFHPLNGHMCTYKRICVSYFDLDYKTLIFKAHENQSVYNARVGLLVSHSQSNFINIHKSSDHVSLEKEKQK